MAVQGHISNLAHDPLWRALQAMRIEPEGAAITFAAKLARDNGWDPVFGEAVTSEYRRFLFLAATADTPVTPSHAVDKAWHLHLTYSRHYWDELCGRILGKPLHHDPSLGGGAEDERHRDQYAATLERYRSAFGHAPPADVWPDRRERRQPRPGGSVLTGLGAAAGASLLLAACTALAGNAGGDAGGWIFPVAAGIFGVILLVALIARSGARKGRDGRESGDGGGSCGTTSSDSDSGSSDGGSSCGGGCGGGD
jgi:hypothetical protein